MRRPSLSINKNMEPAHAFTPWKSPLCVLKISHKPFSSARIFSKLPTLSENMSTAILPSHCMFRSAPQTRSTINAFIKSTKTSLVSVKSVSNAFGLKSSSGFRASAMAVYKVKLVGPEGEEHEFEAPDDAYILDSAENAGVELPYSCRAGACSTCAGQLASGTVDQSDGSFLDENQMKQGYLLTCISYPTQDCVIHTHKEADLY
ncbi:hypothetical protein ACSBR1_033860 [Camellia fascicularis]